MKRSVVALTFLLSGWAQGTEPVDIDSSYQNLQKAVADKDAAQVKKLAVETNQAARAVIASPAPTGDAEKDTWTKQVAYAKEVAAYTEFALYNASTQAKAEDAVDLLGTLEKENPKSKYLDEGYLYYFKVLTETGQAAKIPAIAEKAIANFPGNDDLLLILCTSAFEHKQYDRAATLGTRLVAAASKRPKPEGISGAEWEKKKNTELGQGYYMAGMSHAGKNQFTLANKELRSALPLIQSTPTIHGAALFELGVVNYQIGKMTLNKGQIAEAAKFSEQAAAISGPWQDQAKRNAQLMLAEAKGR
jgi:tetratricopeptide (TPR) repeat protein